MAIPGLANWRQQILQGIGAPVTAQNLRLLDAWQRAEGGTYSNNPFNTTLRTSSQIGSANSAGVRGYATPQAGIDATIQTLLNTGGGSSYANVVKALRAGNNARAVAQAIAASPWGTGQGVLNVLGSGGGAFTPPASPSGVPGTSTPVPQSAKLMSLKSTAPTVNFPDLIQPITSTLGKSPGAQLNAIMGALGKTSITFPELDSIETSPTKVPTSGPVPTSTGVPSSAAFGKGFTPGSPVAKSQLIEVQGAHDTAGLSGFPAHDYMAKAGSAVLAPVGGKIVKLSGHDPRSGPTNGVHGPYGWSLYLQGTDGRIYYMTHLGSRDVKDGQTVKPGQVLGTVGDYARWGGADHVHMGVHDGLAW